MRKVTEQVLANYDRNRFYGSLMLTAQHDTNLPNYPDIIANQQPSGKRSMKRSRGHHRLYDVPVRDWQINATYRNYYNHNLNKNSKGYSFFQHPLSDPDPSARQAVFLWHQSRWQPDLQRPPGGGRTFRPFSLVGNFGPFLRLEYVPRLVMGYEVSFGPKYYLDLDTQRDPTARAMASTRKGLFRGTA